MQKDQLLVVDRMYEFLKWFLGRLAKFPRSHRYGLGQRIEARLYDAFEGLVKAKYAKAASKQPLLATVNLDLETIRMYCRLAHELTLLPHKSHEHTVREMNEIGKMVGGWLKHVTGRKPSSSR